MKLSKSQTLPALILFAVVAVSYGIYAASWGYYWDDWMVVSLQYNFGVQGLTDFLASGGRAFYSYLFAPFVKLWGYRPLYWQLFNVFTHWLAAYSFYGVIALIWQEQRRKALWAALLFAVYPIFFLHAMGMIISLDYLLLAVFFFSLAAMVLAIRQPQRRVLWVGVAVLTAIFHIFVKEYFLGLELVRPLILYFVLEQIQPEQKIKNRLLSVLKYWLPYMLVAGAYVVYRMFLIAPSHEQNPLVMLNLLRSSPLKGLVTLAGLVLRNSLHVLFSAWYEVFQPEYVDLTSGFSLLVWGLSLLVAAGLVVAFLKNKKESQSSEKRWILQALILGIIAILAGFMPSWITGRDILKGLYADRFAMPALMGVSLFWVALVSWFTPKRFQRVLLLSLMVGLAVGLQVRKGNDFRWDWEKQQRFYWQLYWRAPQLEPGTTIMADGSLSGYVNGYSAGFALNVLYPSEPQDGLAPTYWYLDVNDYADQVPEYLAGMPLEDELLNLKYRGDSHQSVFVYFAPESGKCLWLPGAGDVENIAIPSSMRVLAGSSDFSAIREDTDYVPPFEVFGAEPEHTWCYYYQKISLARQQQDWEKVLNLWDEAQQQMYKPNSSFELLPVMEAYAYSGDWEAARQSSKDIYRRDLATQGVLCTAWDQIAANAEITTQAEETILTAREFANCP